VLSEQARVTQVARSLEAGRLAEIGPVLLEGHRSLRDDFEVSCAELDTVVEVAMASGAYGARLTGAGFGGSAIVLARQEDVAGIEKAVTAAFVEQGWGAPRAFTVVPSAGARRES
jgi:galactokinase